MRISDWSSDVCSSDLQKPLDIGELGLIVSRAFHVHALEKENLRLANMGAEDNRVLGSMITGAPEMLTVARTLERGSEERRGGNVGVRKVSSRLLTFYLKQNITHQQ